PGHRLTTHTSPGPRWRCRAGRCCRPAWRSRFPGEGEDLVRGHVRDGTATKPPDDAIATRVPLARGADHPDGVALDDELDLGMGQEADPLPDLGRDRDLALRRDPHPPLHSYVRMVSVREGFSYGNVGRSASARRRGGAG